MYQTIKQLEEKNVAQEIDILVWSNRMDLVAFSNLKGEVALHRLTWARAWNLSPHKDGIQVKAMAWRPDSKIIAIAYSLGEIFLVDVENKNILHKIEVQGEISCLHWVQTRKSNKSAGNLLCEDEENKHQIKYADNSSTFLADLQPLSSSAGQHNHQKPNLCENQKDLNLLIIGTREGLVHLSIFGKFMCATINLNKYYGHRCSILNATFSNDLNFIFITIKDENGHIKVAILNTDIFKTHKHELFAVANKHSHIDNLIPYLWDTIGTIKETWETILLEMDAKLKKYASKVSEGTLTADFLDLLMFGITSTEMQEFLLHDLTEKGLKKFGQVIETCYANIQQLLLKNLTKVGQNITYHLAELRGMARLKTRFEVIGLTEEPITEAINLAGSFLSKGGEMQQIINQSMIKYKAFFRWLYMAIVNLMEEQIPEMPKMTQQDISNITEFILNFDRIGRTEGSRDPSGKEFTMERLGQYLENAPLSAPPNIDENIWNNFLMHNECLREHPDIIRRYQNNSLVQQLHALEKSIDKIFEQPKFLTARDLNLKHTIDSLEDAQMTEIHSDDNQTFVASLDKKIGIFLTQIVPEIKGKSVYIFFAHSNTEKYQITDFKFYSVNILSVLLQESNAKASGLLCQLPINLIQDKMVDYDLNRSICGQNIPKINGFELGSSVVTKSLDDMACSKFAVSGARKVCIVLSKNRKKIRLFEMEADEEEEEDADMTSSIIENSDT
ncbi:anaphase-promoting complex subunit 4 [Agrilus planipennis]|uniref:Anaphase-promoting complex subunit 4 n=1 Tax=Agrilus planipennis TaxID=224129 RepID=A0A1W4X6Z9_AGRPL|nr:anaphase-promoting complex subunit 4 [Agrilus planipennis]